MNTRELKILFTAGAIASVCFSLYLRYLLRSEFYLSSLILPAITLHQFEEFVATEALLGPRFNFFAWLKKIGITYPVKSAFLTDIVLGWGAAVLAFAFAYKGFPMPSLLFCLSGLGNGLWHLSRTVADRSWSPGTATGIGLYLPLSVFLYHEARPPHGLLAILILSAFAINKALIWGLRKASSAMESDTHAQVSSF